MVADDALLEHAEFAGNRYGTPRAPVLKHLAAGDPTLLEIELDGARQVRRSMPEARFVFLAPPSAQRARAAAVRPRHRVAERRCARRLERAEIEMAAASEFDHVVVNHDVERRPPPSPPWSPPPSEPPAAPGRDPGAPSP